MSRHSSDPSAAFLLGIIGGLTVFYKGFRRFREYKLLSDTPRINVRGVPMGFVHLQGNAESSNLLTSPVAHTPCCFYRVEIEHWKQENRGGSWKHFCTDTSAHHFFLSDGTGRILIDGRDAEFDLPQAAERSIDSDNPSSLVTSAGASDNDLLEYVNAARVHAIGGAVTHWMEKRIDKQLDRHSGSIDPQKQQGMLAFKEILHDISDADGATIPKAAIERMLTASGPLADPEKEARRQQAIARLHAGGGLEQIAAVQTSFQSTPATGRFRLRESLVLPGQQYFVSGTCVENPEQDSSDRNMIVKGEHEPTFLISSKPDAQVIANGIRGSALKMVFGGAAVALLCLAFLLGHLHLF
jgi:hypothetical protein